MGRDSLMLLAENGEDEESWCESNHSCDMCGEALTYTDEVYLLELAEAAYEEDGSISCMVLCDESGEYLHAHHLLHFSCWEEIAEELNIRTGDLPPRKAKDIVVECSTCGSAIVEFEPFCATTFGEIRVSQRQPNGTTAETIERLHGPDAVCLCCLVHVIEDYFEEWKELLELQPDHEQQQQQEE